MENFMAESRGAASDPASAAAEIRSKGSVVLRGVWPLEPLAKLRSVIQSFSDLRAQRVAGGEVLVPSERMYATHGVGTFTNLVGTGQIDDGFLRTLFAGSYYQRVCAEYFDDDQFWVATRRLGFRNHSPVHSDRSFIPYHQDSYTQDPRIKHVLNWWIPLDPGAGRESPGLEVVRSTGRPDFPRKDWGLQSGNAAYDTITIDRERIVEEYGEIFLAPEFDVGDGLVFSENVIHRTYVTPTMTKPRINFELRVFTQKSLVDGVSIADFGDTAYRIG